MTKINTKDITIRSSAAKKVIADVPTKKQAILDKWL